MKKKGTSYSSPFWRHVSTLLAVIVVVQWLILNSLILPRPCVLSSENIMIQNQQQQQQPFPSHSTPSDSHSVNNNSPKIEGVAVTIMLRAPKWFHKRYTVMLYNVMANIPQTWKIQVIVNEAWFQKDVLPIHPGMQRLRSLSPDDTHNRILWTPIPKNMTKFKPKEIMKSKWLWESIIHENVLLFGGNGAMCTNTQVPIERFLGYDYVGAPWRQHHGIGGDGSSFSFRHRSAMLEILETIPDDKGEQDYQYFLKAMMRNKKRFRVADKETTIAFGGPTDQTPLLLSGTQANLNWTARETLLGSCPELKMIFPSLHEPSCFGAHPNGTKCKTSICALQDTLPPQGC